MAEQKDIVYLQDGITFYRASSLGLCPNAFIFCREGYPKSTIPKVIQAAYDYGTNQEAEVVEMLQRRGYNVSRQQEEFVLEVGPATQIIGHIDGMATSLKAAEIPLTLVEIKCLNQENTERFLSSPWTTFPSYAWQISAYYHAKMPKQILFAIYNKDTGDLHEMKLDTPPYQFADIISRVTSFESAWTTYQQSDLRPDCSLLSYCPYWDLHSMLKPEIEVVDDPVLSGLIESHVLLARKIKGWEGIQKKLDERIKAHIGTPRSGRVQTDKGFISFIFSKFTSRRLDTKKVTQYLKGEHIYEEYTKETPVTRLEIKVEGGKSDNGKG